MLGARSAAVATTRAAAQKKKQRRSIAAIFAVIGRVSSFRRGGAGRRGPAIFTQPPDFHLVFTTPHVDPARGIQIDG